MVKYIRVKSTKNKGHKTNDMARSHFETLANFLKDHPGAQPVNTRRRGANTNRVPNRYNPPDPDRHRRKCTICRHPRRDDIERDYLRWRSTAAIARDFGIFDHSSICRHALATGLQEQRFRLIAYALHPLLEQSEDLFVKATPSSIISAVRTYAQINDEGRRLRSKPVKEIHYVQQSESPGGGFQGLYLQTPPKKASIRPIQELEDDSTH